MDVNISTTKRRRSGVRRNTATRKRGRSGARQDDIIISADAKRLLRHRRNTEVRWSPNDACFLVKGPKGKSVRRAGLGVMLRRTFWPDYDYRRVFDLIRTDPSARGSLQRRASKERKSAAGLRWEDVPIKAVTGRGHKRRFERGSAVHDELCDYAREGLGEFLRKHPNPEIYTLRIILALRDFGLEPIYGELPIYDEVVGYATAVDMICVDQKASKVKDLGRLVMCEIKTGYAADTFDKGHKAMLGAAGFLPNSRLNQARMQAYFAEMTLRHRYDISNCTSAVILVHDNGVNGYVVTDDIISAGNRMYWYAAEKERVRLGKLKQRKRPRYGASTGRRKRW